MGKKPTTKPKLSSGRAKPAAAANPSNPREESKKTEQELANLVTGKDRDRILQSQAEFDHYRRMIDKVLTSDEEMRSKGRRRGGEIVQLDTDADPSKSDTAKTTAAQESAAITQTAGEEGEAGSDDDHEYDDDNFEDDLQYE